MSFFDLLPTAPIVRGDEPVSTKRTQQRTLGCADCGLGEYARSPKLRFTGYGERGILIVGEQPSRDEDRYGEYGHGDEYKFIKSTLESIGIDIKKDCYYTTAINCAPTKTRLPLAKEITACRANLLRLIERLHPTSIILLGDLAADSLISTRLSGRINGLPISDFMGEHIPDQEYKVWLSPVWAVRTMLGTKQYEDGVSSKPLWERDAAQYKMWLSHLERACNLGAVTLMDYRDQCISTEIEAEAVQWIRNALTWEFVSFDYETTGIKPHREGHKIWTVAISDGYTSYAFPFFSGMEFRAAWKELMLSPVKKVAQNFVFEALWTKHFEGYWPKNWHWDTMLGMHCLNSHKPTGLKFMVYSEYGHAGYDDEVDAFLKPVKAERDAYGTNAINQIHRAPMDKLLLYDALDALYTAKLYKLQEMRLSTFQRQGFDFFMESGQTLIEATAAGFNVNTNMFSNVSAELDKMLEDKEAAILHQPVLQNWTDGKFNHQSGPQVAKLLYDIIGVKPTVFTETGKPSVDEETLNTMDIPIVKDILAYRKVAKMKKTYISQYAVETVNDKIHPFFTLHNVETFRTASNSPNIQNQPKRDKEAKRLLRSFVRPSKGNRIVEFDYKSLEVIVNCCYSKDPTLTKYVTDPTTDMHKDSAADCFLLSPSEVTKPIRNDVKGQFVFAEFYGSYYAQVAKDLWETAHTHNLVDHLASKGIKCYRDFERHIQEAERILWEDRFPVHNEWRKDQWKFYQKHGYVRLLDGFKVYGPMRRNNTFNTPVQGSGSHILLYTMNQMRKKMRKLEQSAMIGEIHDSCIMDAHPSEQDLLDYWYWYYGTQKVREDWEWITVPLTVEKEHSEIDGSWADMSECGALKGD